MKVFIDMEQWGDV